MSAALVRTAPVLDELVGADGAVVLVGEDGAHAVIRLSVLGQAIRELAADGIRMPALEEALVARLGTPAGDLSALVGDAVEALAKEGLVGLDDPGEARRDP